jgi:hypothetical protein
MVASGRILRFEPVLNGGSPPPRRSAAVLLDGLVSSGPCDRSPETPQIPGQIDDRRGTPPSLLRRVHRAGDENPCRSGRPLGRTSQTLSDSRLAPPPI